MNIGNSTKIIRELAKSNYWQTIYSQAKETSLQMFKNRTEFTYIQVTFLNHLGFYSSLFLDIAMGEVEEIVLDNEIYEDSYMYFKRKSRFKEEQPIKQIHDTKDKHVWIFKRPSKGVQ